MSNGCSPFFSNIFSSLKKQLFSAMTFIMSINYEFALILLPVFKESILAQDKRCSFLKIFWSKIEHKNYLQFASI